MQLNKKSNQEILDWFKKQPKGATVDECAPALGLVNNAASASISRLVTVGCLKASKERRKTRSGHTANVYVFVSDFPDGGRIHRQIKDMDSEALKAAKAYIKGRTKVRTTAQCTKLVKQLLNRLDQLAAKES